MVPITPNFYTANHGGTSILLLALGCGWNAHCKIGPGGLPVDVTPPADQNPITQTEISMSGRVRGHPGTRLNSTLPCQQKAGNASQQIHRIYRR
jgi:hypothetical protein